MGKEHAGETLMETAERLYYGGKLPHLPRQGSSNRTSACQSRSVCQDNTFNLKSDIKKIKKRIKNLENIYNSGLLDLRVEIKRLKNQFEKEGFIGEIRLGDEIMLPFDNKKAVVVEIDNDMCRSVCRNGSTCVSRIECLKKTGNNYEAFVRTVRGISTVFKGESILNEC